MTTDPDLTAIDLAVEAERSGLTVEQIAAPCTPLRFHPSVGRLREAFGCGVEIKCQRLGKIEGVGPLSATALMAAVGDRQGFKNGRQFAAWLGLVPKQRSSGGRDRLFGISKRGDRYLRTLLIHGARASLGRARGKQDSRSRWLGKLRERRHPKPQRRRPA
jgi:transposase